MRRRDLEPNGVVCIWVELTLRQKHVLFGEFYRLPSTYALYFSSIEDSIHLAVDTGINDIIVTGDFNYTCSTHTHQIKSKAFVSSFTLVNVYVDLLASTRISVLHRPEVVDIGVNTI